ncbi:3-oxoacyl-[acyl-carrier protein] reductase [Croceicoccus sp. BE223]|nr:3-oxoacyl-[acyl-carrier protein] reductase [Croceicoccus sp. BE223]
MKGRKALVTGAGRGIGRAIARRLAEDGAMIAVVTRGAAAGEETVRDIIALGGSAELICSDLNSEAAAQDAMARAIGALGGLDILVHNAGVAEARALGESGGAFFDTMTAVNFQAALWLTEAALPALRASGHGRALFTSSITGPKMAIAGFAAYGSTKAGLNGFIRMAAAELAGHGITVNGVEPGATLTDALTSAMGDAADAFGRSMPLGRLTRPEDVAAAMAFLASDDAAMITGATIAVDAGQGLGMQSLG